MVPIGRNNTSYSPAARPQSMLALLVLLLIAISCGRDDVTNGVEQKRRFDRSAENTAELIKNANGLVLGDTMELVIAKLGQPDTRAEVAPKLPRETVVRWTVLSYFVHRDDTAVAKDTDQVLEVWFDENERLVRITPRNLRRIRALPEN